jgi:hypothetical protein
LTKKHKINDGSITYVTTATLLEPANNSASNQNESEELEEVSFSFNKFKRNMMKPKN